MANEFYIRPATNEDVPFIKKIVFTVLYEYGLSPDEKGKDKDLDDIKKSYLDPNGFFGVVAGSDATPVGTYGIYPMKDGTCELRKMYLNKEMRGQGLGKMMLEHALEMARQKGFKRIILETISPLKEAISLYRKYGFTEIPPVEISDRVDKSFELIL